MLKNNSERGKNAIIAFWVMFAVTIISAVSTFFEYQLLVKSQTSIITIDEANSNNLRQQILAVAVTACRVVVIVVFIMWLRRAYYNIRTLGYSTRYTDGWAAGAWFVPFMNLYAPYQIVREVWDNTQKQAQQNSVSPRYRNASIIGIWWFLWILTNVIGNFYIRFAFNANRTVENSISIDTVNLIVAALELVNIIVVITIIQKVRIFENEMEQAMLIENIASEEGQPVV